MAEPNGHTVRRIARDGVIHGFAGFVFSTVGGYSGDGGAAKAAVLLAPMDVAVRADGGVLIVEQNNTVRLVAPSGTISTYAGVAGSSVFGGDNGLAAAATFGVTRGIRVAPDGSVYLASTADNRIRRISAALTQFSGASSLFKFASEDGRRLDVFDGHGRHLATTDALTGAELTRFGYDTGGRLSSVTDIDGKVTQIQHDSGGNPTAIVGPFGQTSTLGVESHGYLARVTDPANNLTSSATTPMA